MRNGTGSGGALRRRIAITLMVFATTSAACTASDNATEQVEDTSAGPVIDYVGSMMLEPSTGLPGTSVAVSGEGFTAGQTFDLTWVSAEGSWDIQGDAREEYHGRVFTPTATALDSVTADADGRIAANFEVPGDFGFSHDVRLIDDQQVVRNQARFVVDMEATIWPTSGPVGTPITIEVRGLGIDSLEGNRQIVYDNQYTGWLSGITSKGVGTAVIPATGSVGPHQVRVMRGAFTFPYLNPQQSPRPDIPVFDFVFTVTDDEPILPPPVEEQGYAAMANDFSPPASGQWITTDLRQGPTGTPLLLTGGGFASGDEVSFIWYRIVGNRVAGLGWEERGINYGTAVVAADGTLSLQTEVPRDVGGAHRIEAFVGEDLVATTSFTITVFAYPLASTTVQWGDSVDIHMTGVGWTETANIHTIVYDNAYIGYACGFNSQGDVYISLQATGDPGWHFVDLYPAIYKGKDTAGVQSFRVPMLNFAEHPGEDLPVFHYAFFIEG
jgi:hypothetical protein